MTKGEMFKLTSKQKNEKYKTMTLYFTPSNWKKI